MQSSDDKQAHYQWISLEFRKYVLALANYPSSKREWKRLLHSWYVNETGKQIPQFFPSNVLWNDLQTKRNALPVSESRAVRQSAASNTDSAKPAVQPVEKPSIHTVGHSSLLDLFCAEYFVSNEFHHAFRRWSNASFVDHRTYDFEGFFDFVDSVFFQSNAEDSNSSVRSAAGAPSSMSAPSFVFVDSDAVAIEVKQCIENLKDLQHPFVILDAEGSELGRDGRLCLLQVGIPRSSADLAIFLFDFISFARTYDWLVCSGLADALADSSKVKVFHDARCDIAALYHQFGLRVRGIFDVQVADAFLKRPEMINQPQFRRALHHTAIIHKVPIPLAARQNQLVKQRYSSNAKIWQMRPLLQSLVDYAVSDVVVIHKVFLNMVTALRHLKDAQDVRQNIESVSAQKAAEKTHFSLVDDFLKTALIPRGTAPEDMQHFTEEYLAYQRSRSPIVQFPKFTDKSSELLVEFESKGYCLFVRCRDACTGRRTHVIEWRIPSFRQSVTDTPSVILEESDGSANSEEDDDEW
eukprot:ANDGO_01205.mRNA.1 hypothetical protein SAMD00019534_098980